VNGATVADRLRVGRDVNDSSWVVVRYLEDWRGAPTSNLTYDMQRSGITLAPKTRDELVDRWLASAPVATPGGTQFMADPQRDRILCREYCDSEYRVMEPFGGRGFATGKFHTPVSVTLDQQGLLYVADAGNARVQVIDPRDKVVVAVLTGSLQRPVHSAVSHDGHIYIVDVLTTDVHVFSPEFEALGVVPLASIDPLSGRPWSDHPKPQPMAIGLLADQSLVIFDPRRPLLWHMSSCGEAMKALSWPEPDTLPAGWRSLSPRYSEQGEAVIGPIDSGVHNVAWHQLHLDGEVPPGARIEFQTFASNHRSVSQPAWAPRTPVAVTASDFGNHKQDPTRLILAERNSSELATLGPLTRARPIVHTFSGEGPNRSDLLRVAWEVARELAAGDTITLSKTTGGQAVHKIRSAPDCEITVAIEHSGSGVAWQNPRLFERAAPADIPVDGIELNFIEGAITALGGVTFAAAGVNQQVQVPHQLGRFFRVGDVVAFGRSPFATRFRVVALQDGLRDLQLDTATAQDFSNASLTIESAANRLLTDHIFAQAGAIPGEGYVALQSDGDQTRERVSWVDVGAEGTLGVLYLAPSPVERIPVPDWKSLLFTPVEVPDRGRYLWIRARLYGAPAPASETSTGESVAQNSPLIRAIRAIAPRPNLLHWLPALYSTPDLQQPVVGANFLERFLTLFEGRLTELETAFDSVSRMLNPAVADSEWLDFLASWLELAFDPSWSIERRRTLVQEGAMLQRARGTLTSMRRYLEIYTGGVVSITEQFRLRPPLPIQLGARGSLGVAPLGRDACQLDTSDPKSDGLAHRFVVNLELPADIAREAALSAVHNIIEATKPAHTQYRLVANGGQPQLLGMNTTIGEIVVPYAEFDACDCEAAAERAGNSDRVPSGNGTRGFLLGAALSARGVAGTGVTEQAITVSSF